MRHSKSNKQPKECVRRGREIIETMATVVVTCTGCRRQIRVPVSAQNQRFRCGRCGVVQQIRPRMLVPMPSIIRVGGNKRALLVGVSYKGTPFELDGCTNDVSDMQHLLTTKFNFPADSILTLTEDVKDSKRIPTKKNIERTLRWLVEGCSPGDSLVFHFSGHGFQKPDLRGEEMDGYDETLLPMDFQKAGMIVDNDLNEAIVRPLTPGVRLHAIVDACHSGTIIDIPYVCCLNKDGKCMWEDHTPPNGAYKGTRGGEAFSLTSCADEQTTLDAKSLTKVKSSGIMTHSFMKAIDKGEAATYGKLLRAMSRYIIEAREKSTLPQAAQAFQEPQLSSTYPFDIDDKPFHL